MLSQGRAAHAHAGDLARRRSRSSSRRRTTPRCSPSATWSAPASTSSPTARCGARATPTASPRRSRASTTTNPAEVIDALGPEDAGAARGRQDPAHAGRSSCATCSSCAPTPSGPPRSRCPAPSPWASRRRTSSTRTPRRWRWTIAAAVNEEAHDLVKAGADVIQLDEPWLRNDPGGGQALRGEGDQPRAAGHHGARPSCTCASATPPWCPAAQADRLLLPAAARRQHRRSRSRSRSAQPKLDLGVLKDLAPQEGHAGRDRPQRSRDRDAAEGRRAHPRRPEVRGARQAPARRPIAA